MPDAEALLVLCTCPDQTSADNISEQIITRHLAACVNIIPGIFSRYHWQGKVENDSEVLMLIKTTRTAYDALQGAILELHPYELPEVIAVPIDTGHSAYLDWITENTTRS
ncbi:MAG: divalent-cation tolerance protein CutA [Gammaproteobacteria bacterium]|nr:divalent-cation tolerance protein CutA [Gammaproteobacteria bacterium]